MRITQKMMDAGTLADLNRSMERLSGSQRRMSSLKKVEKPSDAPGDLKALLGVKARLADGGRYKANIDSALLSLGDADSRISYISDQLLSAKETLVRAAGASSQDTRAVVAEQLENIIKGILSEANSVSGGEYVFAGTASGAKPFEAAAGTDPDGKERIQSVTYSGNGAVRAVDAAPGERAAAAVSGEELAAPGAGGLFENLIALRQAAASGADTASLQAGLDASMARLDELQAVLGARQQYLAGLRSRLESEGLDLEARRSSLEDADLAEETLAQARSQTAYQAVLAAAAKRSQLSLINYL